MRGLKFSLIQLLVCIGLILLIAVLLISATSGQEPSTETGFPQQPQATIPFQEIKIK